MKVTTVSRHPNSATLARWFHLCGCVLLGVCVILGAYRPAAAQRGVHYLQSTQLPPGAVAQGQLLRGGPRPGYVQPVQILVPDGAKVSVNVNGHFDVTRSGPVTAGMLIGPVYQLKITNIPFNEGYEVYPTIEVIDRLYPPPGQEPRFPIPVQLTQEELELALSGRFVTRVIYLEDQATALPRRDDGNFQRYFEAPPQQDPLYVADRLGRPMAILRMGSRVPDAYAGAVTAPVIVYPDGDLEPGRPYAPEDIDAAVDRQTYNVPRVPLPRRTASSLHPAGLPQTR